MIEETLEKVKLLNKEMKEELMIMDKAKALRSHPFHNTGDSYASPVTFHKRFAIKKDTDFKWMKTPEQLMIHTLLHLLYDRVKYGYSVEENLTKEDIKSLHQKLLTIGRIPHKSSDELDY